MFRRWALLVTSIAAGFSGSEGFGQTLIPELGSGGTMRLHTADYSVLELREPRLDLPCTVTRIKPGLDWDFTFHTGFAVQLPLSGVVGDGHDLTVLFRVIPEDRPDDPAYMTQKLHVPPVEEGSKGASEFYGVFTLGEGKYHVDWLMRDQWERMCATSWDVDVKLNPKDERLRQWVPHGVVQPLGSLFAEEAPVIRMPDNGLPRINVLVNFDARDPAAPRLHPQDVDVLLAALRRIASDPRLGMYSITAASFETQQVFFQQENTSQIDIPALGEALGSLKFGLVDAKKLSSPNGAAQFETDLIREQLKKGSPDALVVLGRKASQASGVSRETLESLEKSGTPIFYLSYEADQNSKLWRDPIGSIVKRLGGVEYGLSQPKDLFTAWTEVISRIERAKRAGQPSVAAKADVR